MMNLRYITIVSFLSIGVVACQPEIESPSFSNGEADFSSYVAVGNSLTAGFTNGELYLSLIHI